MLRYELVQMRKATLVNLKIAQQIHERTEENRKVSEQLDLLQDSVTAREAIYLSHLKTSEGDIDPAKQVTKLHSIHQDAWDCPASAGRDESRTWKFTVHSPFRLRRNDSRCCPSFPLHITIHRLLVR